MDISEEQFKKMSAREQNLIIFKNTNAVIENQRSTQKELNRLRFHQKVQYSIIGGAVGVITVLINMFFNHLNK